MERALESLSDLVKQLEEKFQGFRRACVETYYDVGKLMSQRRREIEDANEFCRIRQTTFWEEMGDQIGVSSRTLYDCWRFALVINQQQFNRLLECGASWTQIRSLFSAQPELMDSYVDRLVADAPDESELRRQIRDDNAKNAATRKPRSPKPPKTVTEGLTRGLKASEKFFGTHSVIFGDEFDLAAEMLNQASDTVNEEMLVSAQKLAETLGKIKTQAEADYPAMLEALRHYEEVLRFQSDHNEHDDANASEAAKSAV